MEYQVNNAIYGCRHQYSMRISAIYSSVFFHLNMAKGKLPFWACLAITKIVENSLRIPLTEMSHDPMAQRQFFPVILNSSTGSIFRACSSVNETIVTTKKNQMRQTRNKKNRKKCLSFISTQMNKIRIKLLPKKKKKNLVPCLFIENVTPRK